MKLINYRLFRIFSTKKNKKKQTKKETISVQVGKNEYPSIVKEFSFNEKRFKVETSPLAINAN